VSVSESVGTLGEEGGKDVADDFQSLCVFFGGELGFSLLSPLSLSFLVKDEDAHSDSSYNNNSSNNNNNNNNHHCIASARVCTDSLTKRRRSKEDC
jgi:hypothetical protein